MATGGKRCGTVEDSDVVEAEKATLKDIGAVGILAIDPPSKFQQQLVKNFFEEGTIGNTADAALNFIDAPGGPGVHRRIHVTEGPLVRGQLAVRMHVPFA